jgi:hypothetical protein
MTRRRTTRVRFAGAVGLAAAIALTWPATLVIVGSLVGGRMALAVHWLLGAAVYVAWLAPSRRHAVGAVLCVGLGGGALATTMGWVGVPVGAAMPLAVGTVIALARSAVLARSGWVRGLAVEGTLGLFALALVGLLAGPSWVATAASLWGFWLVQSLHPLAPGRRAEPRGAEGTDAFERATARLAALLEGA